MGRFSAFFFGSFVFFALTPQYGERYQYGWSCCWQKQATVRSSVLEVLLEITKFCDLYLMERVLDDDSEVCTNLFCIIFFFDRVYY